MFKPIFTFETGVKNIDSETDFDNPTEIQCDANDIIDLNSEYDEKYQIDNEKNIYLVWFKDSSIPFAVKANSDSQAREKALKKPTKDTNAQIHQIRITTDSETNIINNGNWIRTQQDSGNFIFKKQIKGITDNGQ